MIRVRIKVDTKCKSHPKYNPEKDGHPRPDCEGCDRVYVIYLYSGILAKAAAHDKVTTRGAVLIGRPEEGEKENDSATDNEAGPSKGTDESHREPEKPSDAA